MKVAIYQMEDRGTAKQNIKQAYKIIIQTEADFFVLPEFFAIPGGDFKQKYELEECWQETGRPAIIMLEEASRCFGGYIIGGSTLEKAPEGYYNTCHVFKNGQLVAKYRKINITKEEEDLKVSRGRVTVCFDTPFGKVGLIICADCIYEETTDKVASKSDFVFLPVSLTDPNHPKFEGHPISTQISQKHGVSVIKVTRVGTFGTKRLASKSAVTTPSGVIFEAGEGEELAIVEVQ